MTTTGTPLGLSLAADGYEPRPAGAAYSRRIDPVTRDYAADDDGLAVEDDAIAGAVLIALTQRRGDLEFAPLFGDQTLEIDRADVDLVAQCERYARLALADLVSRGLIDVLGVTVEVATGRLGRSVRWRVRGTRIPRVTVI